MRNISCALLVCALLVPQWACSETHADETILVTVAKGPLKFRGSFYGEVQTRKSVAVHAPELFNNQMFTVKSVLDDGTQVKEGDPILEFVEDELVANLDTEESELAIAEASLRREAERLERERIDLTLGVRRNELALEKAKLFVVEGVNFISQVELDKAKLEVSRAELELELAKKSLRSFAKKREAALEVERIKVATAKEKVEQAKKDLEGMVLTAPADGVIYAPYTRLNWVRGKVAPGKVVRSGDKLLELPELGEYDVHVAVRQKDAPQIKEGDKATVFAAVLPDKPLQGEVVRKDSFATTRNERLGTKTVEGNLKEVLVVVRLEDAPVELRPGGSARVDIDATRTEDALTVPLAALREDADGYAVKLADGTLKPVKVGESSTTHAVILEGLSAGDKVILN